MTIDPPGDLPAVPDASDVVTGPVGSASLRNPATSGPEGARLDRLPVIDATADEQDRAALVPTRPGDWGWGESSPAIRQLETIIDNLTTHATPVLRELAARAAELAAKAGAAAGPVAYKVAALTEAVGGRLAAKAREVASGLREGSASRTSVVPDEPATTQHRPASSEHDPAATDAGPRP